MVRLKKNNHPKNLCKGLRAKGLGLGLNKILKGLSRNLS